MTLLAVALVRQRHGNPKPAPPRPALDPDAVRFYFFGVDDYTGHFWRSARLYSQDGGRHGPRGCPWGDRHVDGILCRPVRSGLHLSLDESRSEEIEGLTRLHHKDGWTAIAYWDRSGPDRRYGCNSNFVAVGTFTFDEMLTLARHHFPHVIARTVGKFEIRLETP
jgi:hypothetical protein